MGNKQSSGDDVRMGPLIGRGAYGEVYSGYWRGRKVALKKLESFLLDGDFRNRGQAFENLRKEWDILSQLNHPNIVEYHTVILSEVAPPIIVTELCDCDLHHFIRENSNRKVCFQDTVAIMTDVAEGLKYLHGRRTPIIHRDLSSRNILLTKSKRAKITDMGLAKAFPQGAMYATAGVGTPVYAAPETYPERRPGGRFAQKAYYTEKIDIFSFGAVLLEVIIGRLPSNPLPDPQLEDGEVVPEHFRRSQDIYDMGLDHPLRKLVISCLDNLPEDRPDAQGLIEFLAKFKSDQDFGGKSTSLSSMSVEYKKSPPAYSSVMHVTKNRYDYNFKVAVLGDAGVGKTSIIQRLLHPNDSNATRTTMKPGDYFERLQYRGKSVHLHIVDTPGERHSIFHNAANAVPQIYRGINGAAIVFDVGWRPSFNSVTDWLQAVHDRSGHETSVILVGNKTDLEPRLWKISSQDAEAYASQNGLFYVETSAIGQVNIDEIFSYLIDRMVQEQLRYDAASTSIGSRSRSPDWVFYQSPKSLLKDDTSKSDLSSITSRATAEPLPTGNIKLGIDSGSSKESTSATNSSGVQRPRK
ncbi:hypothetical protein QZH41_012594, partial [Actinostola sp. cb2023]